MVFSIGTWIGVDPKRLISLQWPFWGLFIFVFAMEILSLSFSSSFNNFIKLPFNFIMKELSISPAFCNSIKDRLWSHFFCNFLGGEPEVVVEANDPIGVGMKGVGWLLWVIVCRFIGGIFIGDYSECFFGYGRRYDLRIGLYSCPFTPYWWCAFRSYPDILPPKRTFPLLPPSYYFSPFLIVLPFHNSSFWVVCACPMAPLAFTIFSTP